MGRKSFVKQLERMPKVDALAIGALALNIYVTFTLARLSVNDLTEPFANQAVTVIQVSALVALVYVIEYMGDEDDSSSSNFGSTSNDEEGFISWMADLAEGSKVVDGLSIAAVFLGYNYVSQNISYGVTITEVSTNPEVISMQLSLLMMANFGVFLISDLLSRSEN